MENPTVDVTVTNPPSPEGQVAPAIVVVDASTEQIQAARVAGEQSAELGTMRSRIYELETTLTTTTASLESEARLRQSLELSLSETRAALDLATAEPEVTGEGEVIAIAVQESESAVAPKAQPKTRGALGRLFLGKHPGT